MIELTNILLAAGLLAFVFADAISQAVKSRLPQRAPVRVKRR